MQYYAKTYTADPKIGLLTPGEFLTEEQAEKLSAEKIADMVARDVLGVAGKACAKKPVKSEELVAPAEDAEEDADTEAEAEEAEAGEEAVETEEAEAEAVAEDDGDELPELDAAGEISEEEEKPAKKPATKKAGRGKTAK